ncbi:MAG: nitrilase-related carbon-nitrogen hydrolase [Methanomicrobiales archaeon]|nr:nitrilase-related carbon-nitrogen hydrolase [Methanomicrobiales archaeon]
MKLCCAQFSPRWGDVASNLRRAGDMMRRAAERGADLICFPEQFATGWSPAPVFAPEDLQGKIVSTLRSFAKEHKIAVLGSFIEDFSPKPRNTAFLANERGEILGLYAKMHPFAPGGEDRFIHPGGRRLLIDIHGVSLGVAICYDLRFPSLFQGYAEEGANAALVPAAWPCRRRRHWQIFVQARAIENQMYVAGINCTGRTPIDDYCGGSMIVDPCGKVAAEAGESEELLIGEIDPDVVRRAREAFPAFGERGGEDR